MSKMSAEGPTGIGHGPDALENIHSRHSYPRRQPPNFLEHQQSCMNNIFQNLREVVKEGTEVKDSVQKSRTRPMNEGFRLIHMVNIDHLLLDCMFTYQPQYQNLLDTYC